MTHGEQATLKEPLIDEATRAFIGENPRLAAKLLCLQGLRGLTLKGGARDMTGLTDAQKAMRLEIHEKSGYVERVEEELVRAIKGTPEADVLAWDALVWRSGFPPHATDFDETERGLVAEHCEVSPFVALAAEYIPQAKGE